MSRESSHTGKIGRLPVAIRNEVNRRLLDNQGGAKILTWLNAQPEVLRVLDEYFNEEPITPQNLSEWRKGGFQKWVERQRRAEELKDLSAFALEMGKAAGGSVADGTAAILGGRILTAIEEGEGWSPEVVKTVALLRMGDHEKIKRDQAGELLKLKRKQIDLDERRFNVRTCELFVKWYNDRKVKDIIESRSSNSEKIEKLGQQIFGEDWQ